jgi:hypothetical protein
MATRVPGPQPYADRLILAPDSSVRDYVGLRFLGAGGMGTVYKGFKNDVPYVLKEVPADQSALVLALTQERSLLERLRHPGIVRFHQLFESDGFYYLALEFINGPPLSALPSRPDEGDVRDWGCQLCDILDYLHTQDPPVIYRDLKPENVLLDGRRLRLIDFGIARLYKGDQRDSDTELMGSVGTASPEHYGGTETDVRSDVYTVGACLYELLNGGRAKRVAPFQFEPIRKVRSEVSEELEAILQKCTEMDPSRRYQSMPELKNALHGGTVRLEALPRPEVAQSPAPSTSTSTASRKAPLLAAAGLLLALSVGAVAWWRGGPGPTPEQTVAGETPHKAMPGKEMSPKMMPGKEISALADAEDPGLAGGVFGNRRDGKDYVVTLGEDIGLFRIGASGALSARARADEVTGRLNELYHGRCTLCGEMKLRPADILIGRYQDETTDEVVLFYAHEDEGRVVDGPVLLATVDDRSARAVGGTPKFAAGHWRNILRDLVQLSRGEASQYSTVGQELGAQLLATRTSAAADSSGEWISTSIRQLTNEQTRRLRDAYRSLPRQLRIEPDTFPRLSKYRELKS